MFSRLIRVVTLSVLYSFLLPNNSLLFCVLIHQLIDRGIVCAFWSLWIHCCEHLCSILSGVQWGVELLDPVVAVYLSEELPLFPTPATPFAAPLALLKKALISSHPYQHFIILSSHPLRLCYNLTQGLVPARQGCCTAELHPNCWVCFQLLLYSWRVPVHPSASFSSIFIMW
jgi:hypothetical protein